MRQVRKGEIYRHFKGQLYQIVTIAKHSETEEDYVVYQALYGDMSVWIRPYKMFVEEVDRNKYPGVVQKYRFELLSTLAVEETRDFKGYQEQTENIEKQKMQELCIQDIEDENEGVDERLIAFLNADTYREKINCLRLMKNGITDKLIDDMAASLDLMINEGSIDERFESLIGSLQIKSKYECSRLR